MVSSDGREAEPKGRTEMKDKNGTTIKVGDIVKVEGGYFKTSNGQFVVRYAPGAPGWSGNYCSLTRMNRNGTLSKSKGRTQSWPIHVYVNDYALRAEAKHHNEQNATVEVIGHID